MTIESLSKYERADLAECEEVIERALQAFDDFGRALRDIRDRRLYRAQYPTWEEYCQGRWSIKGSRARQLIAAALVKDDTTGVAPLEISSEAQARPLAGLSTEERQDAWSLAAARAEGESPTGGDVRQAVGELADLRAAVVAVGGIWYSSRDGQHLCDVPGQPAARRYTTEALREALGIQTVEVEPAPGQLPETIYDVVEQMAQQIEAAQPNLSPKPVSLWEQCMFERASACGYEVRHHGEGLRYTKNGFPYGGATSMYQFTVDLEEWEKAAGITPDPDMYIKRRDAQIAAFKADQHSEAVAETALKSVTSVTLSPEEESLIQRAAACGYVVEKNGKDAHGIMTKYTSKERITGQGSGTSWGLTELRDKVQSWEQAKAASLARQEQARAAEVVQPQAVDTDGLADLLRTAFDDMSGRQIRCIAVLLDNLFWESAPAFMDTIATGTPREIADELIRCLCIAAGSTEDWPEESLSMLNSLILEEVA